jgi:hypothetical protein
MRFAHTFATGLTLCAFTSGALAGVIPTYGATFTITNGNGGGSPFNTVAFALTNLSGSGSDITQMRLTIGDTRYSYDFLYLSEESFSPATSGPTATLTQGDRTDDFIGPDAFAYAFSGFTPGVTFRGQWDIDDLEPIFDVDARTVLFNNGDAPNAVLTLIFDDGTVISSTLTDGPAQQSSYSWFIVPAPQTCAALGLLALRASRRAR